MAEIKASDVKVLREMTGAGMMDCKKALVEAEGDIDKAATILREKGIAKTVKKAGRITAEGLVDAEIDGNTGVLVEVNSETDFVAKNPEFKQFVKDITKQVLANDTCCVKSEEATGNDLFSQKFIKDESKNVETALKELIAKIGENIVIRRFEKITSDGVIGAYIHGGRIGVLTEITSENNVNNDDVKQLAKDIAMQVAASSPKYINREDVPAEVIESEKEILVHQALLESPEGMDEAKARMVAEKKVEGRLNKQLFAQIVLVEQPFIKEPSKSVAQVIKEVSDKVGTTLTVANFTRFEVGEGLEKREENFAEEVAKQMAGN